MTSTRLFNVLRRVESVDPEDWSKDKDSVPQQGHSRERTVAEKYGKTTIGSSMGVSGALGAGSSQKSTKKWRPFRATDYISLMRPCFELLRIHGLFPYKITSSSTIVPSKPGYVYSTVLTFLMVGLTALILYQVNISRRLRYTAYTGDLQCNCYLLLGCAVGTISYVHSSRRMRLLNDLAEISTRLPQSSYSTITKIVHAKDVIGFLFLAGQIPNIYSTDLCLINSKAVGLYVTLVVYLMDSLYVDSVFVLRACFERINENLLSLKDNLGNEEPHLLRRVYHEHKNPIILLEIRAMKRQHNEISEIVQRLNSTFSLQMVATATLTFAEITFSLYFYILQFNDKTGLDVEKQIWYYYFVTSVTYYAVKMMMIVWACETAKAQAMRTGIIVHEVLIDTTDKQVKEELQLFSLQLLHRDNSFQAKGLALDATLITAIVGGITTYLLILIQFLFSGKSCSLGSKNQRVTTVTSMAQ